MDLGMRDKLLQKLVELFSGMDDGDDDKNSALGAEGSPAEESAESPLEESQEDKPKTSLDVMIAGHGAPSLGDDLKNKLMKG